MQAKTIGVALRALDAVAPRAAGRRAFDVFCTPPSTRFRTSAERRALETLSANLNTAEAHRVATPDAEVQAYLWRAGADGARRRVLLVHGWTAEARVMTLFVEPLRRAGFDVVAIDLPAHGHSTGSRLNMPIAARALLAVETSLGPFHGVVAHSFGGLASALAVEGGSPLTAAMRVSKLVLIATPHSLVRLIREFGQGLGFNDRLHTSLEREVARVAGRPAADISTGGMLKAAGIPTLVIQDDDDDIVPGSDGPAIVAASGATLLATKGLGHRRIIVMPAIVRASVRFLNGEAT